nr:hypothetical protein [uncultured Desulfobulbus sp.]
MEHSFKKIFSIHRKENSELVYIRREKRRPFFTTPVPTGEHYIMQPSISITTHGSRLDSPLWTPTTNFSSKHKAKPARSPRKNEIATEKFCGKMSIVAHSLCQFSTGTAFAANSQRFYFRQRGRENKIFIQKFVYLLVFIVVVP